jgi:pimeloyl-ACP methyl ester carboxylesterase
MNHDHAPRVTPFRETLFREGGLKDLLIDGRRCCVADLGQGAPVVLVHGLGGSLYDWRHLIRPLAEGHRVIAPDLLGSGESDHPAGEDYSIAAQARRLGALLEALSVERATLVGNSYGGGIVLRLAQARPDLFERLVLLNSVCYPEHIPTYLVLAKFPLAGLLVEGVPLGKFTRRVLGKKYRILGLLTEEEGEAYRLELRRPGRRRVMVEILRSLIPADVAEFQARLRDIDAPALLIWGAADPTIPIDLGRRLAGDLPNARLVELDAGHVPHQERPAEVLRLMREFVP